ncbi:hypothetical protein L1987_45274 [Smallanthus sonchifolius]|uniref:Uncharacterized protein n=1 Tax=Smallanthus sonchifolius TaxID=185202 RepID=A0ACB9GRI9_9ASTR|nr:hypothetical protein L1987_45274 [Smallanthus sonchifolius]
MMMKRCCRRSLRHLPGAANSKRHQPLPRSSSTRARSLIQTDGVFFAELNEVLTREFAEDKVRVTPMRTEIIFRATRTQNVLGEKGRRIRELTSLVH